MPDPMVLSRYTRGELANNKGKSGGSAPGTREKNPLKLKGKEKAENKVIQNGESPESSKNADEFITEHYFKNKKKREVR